MLHKTTVILILLFATSSFADTIYLKTGKSLKGVVVEEYADRVVISTHKGEKCILKDVISKVIYDRPEQNLVRLGNAYMARREYEKAYFAYERAQWLNPESKVAREKMNYVTGFYFRKQALKKMDDIKRMQEHEDRLRQTAVLDQELEKDLLDKVGIKTSTKGGRVKVDEVIKGSPAFDAGIRRGDTLVSVWGALTGYMSEDDVARLFLKEGIGEIKAEIERDVTVMNERPRQKSYADVLGGKLEMLFDGLTLVKLGADSPGREDGLEEGDLITEINGESTRYMPLKKATGIIEKSTAPVFTLRRKVTIWRA